MKPKRKSASCPAFWRAFRSRGFTTVEMMVTVAVILALGAIATPMLLRTLQIYQLNNCASQAAGMLKLTRFEAIRKNTNVSCQFQQVGTDWVMSATAPGGGVTQTQYRLTGGTSLLPDGEPPAPTQIAAALGGAALNTLSGANGSVTFDARGAVTNGATVDVWYIGTAGAPERGYRAVVLLPSGVIHVWTAGAGGPWQQVS